MSSSDVATTATAAVANDVAIYTTYVCYGNGGTLAYIVATTAYIVAVVPWWMLKGILVYDSQLLVYILNFTYFPLLLIITILQEAFKEPRICQPAIVYSSSSDSSSTNLASPGPGGAGGGGGGVDFPLYGMPCYESFMTFTFLAFVLSFYYFRKKRINFDNSLSLVVAFFVTVWGLWYTGNYLFYQIAAGALGGTLVGLGLSVAVYFFWVEDFPLILNLPLMRKTDLYDSICSNVPIRHLPEHVHPKPTVPPPPPLHQQQQQHISSSINSNSSSSSSSSSNNNTGYYYQDIQDTIADLILQQDKEEYEMEHGGGGGYGSGADGSLGGGGGGSGSGSGRPNSIGSFISQQYHRFLFFGDDNNNHHYDGRGGGGAHTSGYYV